MQQVLRLWALRQDLPDACGWRRWRNSNSKEEVVICPFQFYFVSGPITHVAILWNVEKGNLLKTLLDHHNSHPRRRSPQRGRRHQRRRRPQPRKNRSKLKLLQPQVLLGAWKLGWTCQLEDLECFSCASGFCKLSSFCNAPAVNLLCSFSCETCLIWSAWYGCWTCLVWSAWYGYWTCYVDQPVMAEYFTMFPSIHFIWAPQ